MVRDIEWSYLWTTGS